MSWLSQERTIYFNCLSTVDSSSFDNAYMQQSSVRGGKAKTNAQFAG